MAYRLMKFTSVKGLGVALTLPAVKFTLKSDFFLHSVHEHL